MDPFTIRIAESADIPAMHVLRMSVKENALNNPLLVTEKDYVEMLQQKGRGWVCLVDGMLVGFAIVDLTDRNIWALFVAPGQENRGFGRALHDEMLEWSFKQEGVESLWLTTAPGTRAEYFYRKAGWIATGTTKHGEVYFEMERTNPITSKTKLSQ